MRSNGSALLASLAVGILTGCARPPQMAVVAEPAMDVRPTATTALVMFVRPSRYFGKVIGSALYDGDTFLGLLTNNTVFALQASPGPHTFMLLSGQPAAPAFLTAELQAARTYYVQIAPRSKWTRPPFHLLPMDPATEDRRIRAWLGKAVMLKVDDQARRWEAEHGSSAEYKRIEGLRRSAPKSITLGPQYAVDRGTTTPAEAFSSMTPAASAKPESASASTRLRELDKLRSEGLISEEEYVSKRQAILREL